MKIGFSLFSNIDVYDRSIVDNHIGLSCTSSDVNQALERVLFKCQQFDKLKKPKIRTDNACYSLIFILLRSFVKIAKLNMIVIRQ